MACVEGSGFTDRKDEAYIKFLEDSYQDAKAKEAQLQGAADPVLTAIF